MIDIMKTGGQNPKPVNARAMQWGASLPAHRGTSAECPQERTAVPRRERVSRPEPLDGALELGAGSARTHHVAASEDHCIGAAAFSPQGARHGLVQVRHALLDAALLDERGADLAQRTQLEIEIAGQAGSLERFARPRFAADWDPSRRTPR
jgi:hypothetical protein